MKSKTSSVLVKLNGQAVLLPYGSMCRQSEYEKKLKDIAKREKAAKKYLG